MLFQCVDLHNNGVYDCDGNTTAAVVCLNNYSLHNITRYSNVTVKLTTELYSMDSTSTHGSSLSNIHIAILGSVGTAAVATGLVIITVITVVFIQKMKMKR